MNLTNRTLLRSRESFRLKEQVGNLGVFLVGILSPGSWYMEGGAPHTSRGIRESQLVKSEVEEVTIANATRHPMQVGIHSGL